MSSQCRASYIVGVVVMAVAVSAVAQTAAPASQPAEKENPFVWKPKTTSVAVFKNGLGFFIRQGQVDLRDGWCVSGEIPPALFGTLAIYSDDKGQVVDTVGAGPGEVVDFDGQDAGKDDAAKRARLETCKQLNIQLTYTQRGSERKAAGKLLSVGPDYAVLESASATSAVPVAGITRLQVLDLPLRLHVAQDNRPAKSAKLQMAYLSKGITWIPEYSVRILDDENAEITLRGTLVNEAEDLVHADVDLVVGVPHFEHTGYLSPIAVGQIIRSIGSAVAPEAVRTQIMNRAAIASNSTLADQFGEGVVDRPPGERPRDVAGAVAGLPQLDNAAATDYTVYTRKDLTLRRGEKAILTLMTRKVRYGHIYRWSPPKQLEHSLVLLNDTDSAWTTGPCLTVSDKQPLSEDLLKYTPKGGKCEIPVTAAVNIASDRTEQESGREMKAYKVADTSGSYLDKVTISGELKLKNFEKRPADIEISMSVPGKPEQASDSGKPVADATRLQLKELSGTITWRLKLDPGQAKTLTYSYVRWVPSN